MRDSNESIKTMNISAMDVVISVDIDKKDNTNVALLDESIIVTSERYPISEFSQFYIILKRALLFSRRDWVCIWKSKRYNYSNANSISK
jgi:hypothetical protein